MAVGKNKRISKGKKGLKKKIVDPFTRKDWYDVKAPAFFPNRQIGKTIVNRTAGLKHAEDFLRGRVVEISLADLNGVQEDGYRNFRFKVEDIHGTNCLTNFYGMRLSTDKIKSLIKKWQTLVDTHYDVKTTDGYLLRVAVIGFTRRAPGQIKKTSYASASQIRAIRKKVFETVKKEFGESDMKEVVKKLSLEVVGKKIEKSCANIFPLQNIFVRKVRVLKAPKIDAAKLTELHGSLDAATGASAPKGEWKEPEVQATV